MATKASLYIRVKVRELFPPDDPIVPSLLRLMTAVNDLRTLQKMWLHANSRKGTTQSEKAIIKAESIYLFRLTFATLYEAAKAFQDFKKALTEGGQLASIEKMGTEAREAFHTLANAFQEKFEETEWGKKLLQLRQSAFHYYSPKVFRQELLKHRELGDVIIGEIDGVSRYLVTDDLQVQIIERVIGADFENELRALGKTVAGLTGELSILTDHWIDLQIKSRADAIVERREDSVDMDGLWKILAREGEP